MSHFCHHRNQQVVLTCQINPQIWKIKYPGGASLSVLILTNHWLFVTDSSGCSCPTVPFLICKNSLHTRFGFCYRSSSKHLCIGSKTNPIESRRDENMVSALQAILISLSDRARAGRRWVGQLIDWLLSDNCRTKRAMELWKENSKRPLFLGTCWSWRVEVGGRTGGGLGGREGGGRREGEGGRAGIDQHETKPLLLLPSPSLTPHQH